MDVIQKGIYYLDGKPFLVKPWTPKMNINTEALTSPPLWVQFPDLDIRYWGLDSLSKIGTILGIPMKTDKYTEEKSKLQYARLLIEVSLEGLSLSMWNL